MYRAALVVLVILLVLLQYRLWLGDGGYAGIYRLEREIADQARTNESLDARNRQLEAEVSSLKEGDVATEERARSDLGMVKEGESFFLIVKPQEKEAPPQERVE
jgi:cell division protein FtsB